MFKFYIMYPGKKVGADPIWDYRELCPADLIDALHLEHAAINQEEFLRAQWFSNRRPKLLCENLIFRESLAQFI